MSCIDETWAVKKNIGFVFPKEEQPVFVNNNQLEEIRRWGNNEIDETDNRQHTKNDDFTGIEPVQLFAFVEHDLQGANP